MLGRRQKMELFITFKWKNNEKLNVKNEDFTFFKKKLFSSFFNFVNFLE